MVHDILLGHGAVVMHAQTTGEAVSFLNVAPAMQALTEATHNLAHWVGDHISLIPGLRRLHAVSASEAATVPASDSAALIAPRGSRFVEYFAKDCPHCIHLAPTWKNAAQAWEAKHPDSAVSWEQKECFGPGWKPGKDFEECTNQQVEAFPTIKFYGKGDNVGKFFDDDRSEGGLLKFLEDNTSSKASISHEAKALPGREQMLEESVGAAADIAGTNLHGGRIIEYFAKDCPHCQHMEPVWKEAVQKWSTEHPGDSAVSWEQKECYSSGWADGQDHDECVKEGIHGFPTVRFYDHSGQGHDTFDGERTSSNLLKFVHDHASPAEEVRAEKASVVPEHDEPQVVQQGSERLKDDLAATAQVEPAATAAAAGAAAPLKVVAYVAKSCPHCQHLEPVWKDAQAAWQDKHSNVSWEQKECFAEGWKPGKDLEECKRENIHGFPTIKLYGGSSPNAEEFLGDRTASSINDWVREQAGLDAMKASPVQAAISPELLASVLCQPSHRMNNTMTRRSFI
mmetsp:Transcript_73999/g.130717  ORF Transcript_73999/g.130717 Transcript_73999/m.130717 type:complete len:511 (+) Transcript_73999:128-1660(+)